MKLSKRSITNYLVSAGIAVPAVIFVFPFFWLVITSFKFPEDILILPPRLWPRPATLRNYRAAVTEIPFLRLFLNTLRYAAVSTLAILFTSSLAGFVFAKYKFRGKKILFALMITTMMIPFQSYMVPLYMLMLRLGAVDTYWGLQLPYLVQAMGTFFMRQNFESFPDDYLEAGRMEGLGEFALFRRLGIPNLRGALSGLSIFIFSVTWGSLLWPLIITSSTRNFVLELGIARFQQRFTVLYGEFTAAAALAVLPLILFFVIFRRQMMNGITLSGLK